MPKRSHLLARPRQFSISILETFDYAESTWVTEVVLVRRVVKVFGAIPTLATSRGEPEGSS